MSTRWWTEGLTEICEQFQLDLSCLVDGELDEAAGARAIAHLEECDSCREFFEDTRLQVSLHRDMSDPERLLERYSALTGAELSEELESLELVNRLASIFYQLGKAYVLSDIDPGYRERVFEQAVKVDTEQTRGRGFVDGVISRGRSNAGGVDWRHAHNMLNGQLSKIERPLEKGRRLLQEAVQVDPSHEGARLYLAFLDYRDGRHVRAAAEFRRIFNTALDERNRGHAAVQLGKLYAKEGDHRKAIACFRWVRMSGLEEVEDKFFAVGFNIGVCYAHLRDAGRSVASFRDVLDRHPGRVTEVAELFAGSTEELRAIIQSQPRLIEGLVASCPELFEAADQQGTPGSPGGGHEPGELLK